MKQRYMPGIALGCLTLFGGCSMLRTAVVSLQIRRVDDGSAAANVCVAQFFPGIQGELQNEDGCTDESGAITFCKLVGISGDLSSQGRIINLRITGEDESDTVVVTLAHDSVSVGNVYEVAVTQFDYLDRLAEKPDVASCRGAF